jgi:hypothetical protein
MDRVRRVTEDMKTRALISREERILKRMRESKDFDDSLIDLTLTPIKAKHTGSEAIIDARYEDIEKLLLDEMRGSDPTDTKAAAIKEKAEKAKKEETHRMKECYLNPDYMAASQKARESRQKMIELLEAQGIAVDESFEL